MTAEICLAYAKAQGATYAGLEYSTECWVCIIRSSIFRVISKYRTVWTQSCRREHRRNAIRLQNDLWWIQDGDLRRP